MGPESTNGKIVGVISFAWFLYSVSLSLSLSLSRSLALSLFLSLIIIYTHICAWQPADSRVTSDHCRVTLRWLFTKSFLIAWNVQKRCLTVADGRVTSDHCRVTVQRHFSKKFPIAQNVQKTLLDSRPTVEWPPTTVAWPFSDFFQKIF